MGEELLLIIKRVGIFIVCAQMLLHFKPSESYGKYIRLLMSVMVLAELISPVMAILGRGSEISFEARVLEFDEILRQGMEEADRTGAEAQAMLETMTLEEIKSRINVLNTEEAEERENAVSTEIVSGDQVQTGAAGAQAPESERLVERIEVKLND